MHTHHGAFSSRHAPLRQHPNSIPTTSQQHPNSIPIASTYFQSNTHSVHISNKYNIDILLIESRTTRDLWEIRGCYWDAVGMLLGCCWDAVGMLLSRARKLSGSCWDAIVGPPEKIDASERVGMQASVYWLSRSRCTVAVPNALRQFTHLLRPLYHADVPPKRLRAKSAPAWGQHARAKLQRRARFTPRTK